MGPSAFMALPSVPPRRVCSCGQPTRWSHLQYLGRGRSAPIHLCVGCGLAYRGGERDRGREPTGPRRERPLPRGGPPDNPVLDEEVATKLRQLVSPPDPT